MKAAIVAGARLDHQRSAALPERRADPDAPFQQQSPDRLGHWTSQQPRAVGRRHTFQNRVPGQPLFLVDPNSHFDPTTQLVLNPAAWTDAPLGTVRRVAPYYNDFRWQRQPAESLGFGRIFRIKEGMSLQVRAEFQNIFNRMFYSLPGQWSGNLRRCRPPILKRPPLAAALSPAATAR